MEKEKWIEIKNQGEIELAGLTLLGACTKDESSIGFFGSGNKYAVATLMRKDHEFIIFSGMNEVEFTKEEVFLRGQKFEQILINGETTSLTTSMGPDWESWFVLREFWSNAKDEGEEELNMVNDFNPEEGTTKIYIKNSGEFLTIMEELPKYFVDHFYLIDEVETPSYGKVKFLGRPYMGFNMFRKGISIVPSRDYDSLYWYDVEDIKINESRVIMHDYQLREVIAYALAMTKNKDIIENYLLNNKDRYESSALFEYISSDYLTDEWFEVLKDKELFTKSAVRDSDELSPNTIVVPDSLGELLVRRFKELKIVGIVNDHYDVINIDKDKLHLDDEFKKDVFHSRIDVNQEEQQEICDFTNEVMMEMREKGFDLKFNVEFIKAANDREHWFRDGTLYINLKKRDNVKFIFAKAEYLSQGYYSCSKEFEDFLLEKVLSLTEKVNELSR